MCVSVCERENKNNKTTTAKTLKEEEEGGRERKERANSAKRPYGWDQTTWLEKAWTMEPDSSAGVTISSLTVPVTVVGWLYILEDAGTGFYVNTQC